MAVVAGIDEAGYGPILGPLVMSAAAFRVPDACAGDDLWDLLSEAVTRTRSRADSRVRVADSKQVYNRAAGLGSLERHLLPFQAVMTTLPLRLSAFSRVFGSMSVAALAGYPWYRDRDPALPRAHSAEDIARRAEDLRAGLASAGCAVCATRFETVHVAAFNREVAQVDNKAAVLSRRLSILMARLWDDFGAEEVTLHVDRQGGRKRYGRFLSATFPFHHIETIMETADRSAYRIEESGKRMNVSFESRCDVRHLPTALASMLSKYVREVFLEMLNDYWCMCVPNLKRTAGYYSDGRRFLEDIERARRKEDIPLSLMVRCR